MTNTSPADNQPDPNSTNPLISVGTITALASAVLAAAVAFGLDISDDRQAAILAAIGVLAPIVVALWGRRRVYAPATVASLLAACRPKLATGGAYRLDRTAIVGEHGPETVKLPEDLPTLRRAADGHGLTES